MFTLIGTTTHDLTEQLVNDFANMRPFAGERPFKEVRQRYLKARLDDGHFHSPRWAVAWFNGVKYRMNGQHSSKMLAECNGSFPKCLKAIIDEYRCDTESDMAELFSQFDDSRSVRSATDVVTAHARTHRKLDDCAPTNAARCCAGISLAFSDNGRPIKTSPEDRAALIHENVGFILWANEFVSTKTLRMAGAVAAMYLTYRRDKAAADEFWKMVRDETAPFPEHPTRVLSKLLRSTPSATKRAKGNVPKMFSTRAVFVKSLHAWNAYRRKTTTNLKYFDHSPIPELA